MKVKKWTKINKIYENEIIFSIFLCIDKKQRTKNIQIIYSI